jgi:hypothetical protein
MHWLEHTEAKTLLLDKFAMSALNEYMHSPSLNVDDSFVLDPPSFVDLGVKIISPCEKYSFVYLANTLRVFNVAVIKEDSYIQYSVLTELSWFLPEIQISVLSPNLLLHQFPFVTHKIEKDDFLSCEIKMLDQELFEQMLLIEYRRVVAQNSHMIYEKRRKRKKSISQELWETNMEDPELAYLIEFTKTGKKTRNNFYKLKK